MNNNRGRVRMVRMNQRDLTRPPQQMVKFWYNFGVFDLKRFFFIKCRFILQKFWQFLSKNDTKILPKTFW